MSSKDGKSCSPHIWKVLLVSLVVVLLFPTKPTRAGSIREEVGKGTTEEQAEMARRASFVKRIADMLVASGTVDARTDSRVVCTKVAEVLDEAEGHGIKTQRLMGMYVLLKISDKVDPYSVPAYAAVLRDPTIEEAEKAHLLQMMRVGALSEDEVLQELLQRPGEPAGVKPPKKNSFPECTVTVFT